MGRQIAVKHVVSDIDLAIRVPASEREVICQKYGFGKLEPCNLLGLLGPKLFSKLWGACFSKGFFVRVLIHQIKFIKGGTVINLSSTPQNSNKIIKAHLFALEPSLNNNRWNCNTKDAINESKG